jgi:hypothetical protein
LDHRVLEMSDPAEALADAARKLLLRVDSRPYLQISAEDLEDLNDALTVFDAGLEIRQAEEKVIAMTLEYRMGRGRSIELAEA